MTQAPSGDWNATSYDKVADPQTRWGAEVLERLPLDGDETVLDAGCGTGRVTELLLARLPRGRVIALDFSAAMLEQARARLARFGDQVTYVQADLGQPLPLTEKVDAILSTATFHWVPDHDAMFANLASVLRPGSLLVAQCGGFGNIARFLEAARSVDPNFARTHNFQPPDATKARLEASGFEDIQAWLSEAPTHFEPGAPFEAFLETVCLRTYIDGLPPEDRSPFIKAVAARLPEPMLDYVRLNIVARRAPEREAPEVPPLREVPLDSPAWGWRQGDVVEVEFAGHRCIEFGESVDLIAPVAGVELTDGVIELDLALTGDRAFHGVVWRVQDDEDYESFYVRPHQVGNDDAIQYNPVFNGVASWQLYHGLGFWAPIAFPIGRWFTIRVVFAGSRAEVFVGDLAVPALQVAELKMPVEPGGVGILIGGRGLYVSRFAYSEAPPAFVGTDPVPQPPDPPIAGLVPAWLVSDAFAEPDPVPLELAADVLAGRAWTQLRAEPTGLVNLAKATGIRDGRNTVWARATVHSERARVVPMALGFSDRAVVYLNGTALYRGDDTYRSRDYRFLGSIGWYDTVFLPLHAGENDVLIAVTEDLGGWGIQARFEELDGIRF